jgi:very-short-patch-repair endonuclease
MPARVDEEKTAFARRLRRKMTTAEEILWRALRGRKFDDLKFRRQVPIGRFVVDFLCVEHRFIIELDGAPHERLEQQDHDALRDAYLRERGYRILRLKNDVVIGGGDLALEMIREAMRKRGGVIPWRECRREGPHPTRLRRATFSHEVGEGYANVRQGRDQGDLVILRVARRGFGFAADLFQGRQRGHQNTRTALASIRSRRVLCRLSRVMMSALQPRMAAA